jgi:hypothetical protein
MRNALTCVCWRTNERAQRWKGVCVYIAKLTEFRLHRQVSRIWVGSIVTVPALSRVDWLQLKIESNWNVMAHGEAREGKWRGNWRMEWVASTLHTTSEHDVSSITTADAHTSAASSRLNWRPRRFKWTRPFRRKTKSGFCACAITFLTQSTIFHAVPSV